MVGSVTGSPPLSPVAASNEQTAGRVSGLTLEQREGFPGVAEMEQDVNKLDSPLYGMRLRLCRTLNDLKVTVDDITRGRDIKLAISGYSDPPSTDYAPLLKNFLELYLRQEPEKMALCTSPTMDEGSVDRTVFVAGSDQEVPVVQLTSQNLLKYVKGGALEKENPVAHRKYSDSPKFVFDNQESYSQAQAQVSNCQIIAGGRIGAVADFVNAIGQGNKVMILDMGETAVGTWDEVWNRPDNASRYLADRIDAFQKGEKKLPHHPCVSFTDAFLEEHKDKLSDLVQVIKLEPNTIEDAVRQTLKHLNGRDELLAHLG